MELKNADSTVVRGAELEVTEPPAVLCCSPEATNRSSWAAPRSAVQELRLQETDPNFQRCAQVSMPEPLLPQVIAINTNVLLFDQSAWINVWRNPFQASCCLYMTACHELWILWAHFDVSALYFLLKQKLQWEKKKKKEILQKKNSSLMHWLSVARRQARYVAVT